MHKVDSFEMLQQKFFFATWHTDVPVLFSGCMVAVTGLSLGLVFKDLSVSCLDFVVFLDRLE